jgi:FemAB-related protein (PEP-CTERM system-associated)
MTLEVRHYEEDRAEWDAYVHASSDGTAFHLIAWKEAVEAGFGHRPLYLLARRAGVIEGVLPLFEVNGLLGGRRLVSVPYAVYGGVCATSDEARHALVQAARELGAERRAAYVELRHRRNQGLNLPIKSLYVTFTREISPDVEANARALPGKQRRMTRQGSKHGLRAEMGREHLDSFYDVYADSVRHLGSPVFPRRFFRAVREAFAEQCAVLTVWQGDRLVSGVLSLFFRDQVLPYYGGARREALRFAVNDFMYWELMCYAARSGFRVFDFGRSRQGTGAYDFKRHWGFEPVPLPYQYVLLRRETLPDLSPSNPRFRVAAEVWKRLPASACRFVGPVITRYLP